MIDYNIIGGFSCGIEHVRYRNEKMSDRVSAWSDHRGWTAVRKQCLSNPQLPGIKYEEATTKIEPVMFLAPIPVLLSHLQRTVRSALSYGVAEARDYDTVQDINARQNEDDIVACLHQLVALSGGSWPPRTTYGDEWPPALRAYHEAYKVMAPSLSTEDISLDDEHNLHRTSTFRMGMTKALESVDLEAVCALLKESDKADSVMTPADWNGFFACIAVSRHAYRWGTIPVAKVVQNEKLVQFPKELDIPWPFLQHRYGVSSLGGCVTSNYLCNFHQEKPHLLNYA